MTVVVKRTSDGYELVVDGDVVETYSTETMRHPDDWIDDATSVGASGWEIVSGKWEYDDTRNRDEGSN